MTATTQTATRPAPTTKTVGEEVFTPEQAKTPSQLRRAYSDEDLRAFSTCLHGYKIDGKPADPPLEDVLLFMWRCRQTGLDPFSGHLVGVYRLDREEGMKLSIQTEVQGLRSAAFRSGDLLEISEPTYDRERDGKPPVWARVTVKRIGPRQNEMNFMFTAYYSEFHREKSPVWGSMPWHMLGVRATGHALKNAFPDILAGIDTAGGDDDGDRPVSSHREPERAPAPKPPIGPETGVVPVRKTLPAPVKVGPAAETAPAGSSS